MSDQDASVRHEDLPIPDYDHLPIGDLGHRIRSLDAGGLGALLAYERAHKSRKGVVQALESRLSELSASV